MDSLSVVWTSVVCASVSSVAVLILSRLRASDAACLTPLMNFSRRQQHVTTATLDRSTPAATMPPAFVYPGQLQHQP